jgi:hypothetical protein
MIDFIIIINIIESHANPIIISVTLSKILLHDFKNLIIMIDLYRINAQACFIVHKF